MQNVQNLNSNVAPVILAGGYGQINQGTSKVLEIIGDKPMIVHVAEVFRSCLGAHDPIVIVNDQFGPAIEATLRDYGFDPHIVVQTQRVGNAGAIELCLPHFVDTRWRDAKHVAVLYGDMPNWQSKTMDGLIHEHVRAQAMMSMVYIDTNCPNCPPAVRDYGRILHDGNGQVALIVDPEELGTHDLTDTARVNPSLYVFNRSWLAQQLPELPWHDRGDGFSPEKNAPDLFVRASQAGEAVVMTQLHDPHEALGVNTLEELKFAREHIARRAERAAG